MRNVISYLRVKTNMISVQTNNYCVIVTCLLSIVCNNVTVDKDFVKYTHGKPIGEVSHFGGDFPGFCQIIKNNVQREQDGTKWGLVKVGSNVLNIAMATSIIGTKSWARISCAGSKGRRIRLHSVAPHEFCRTK